MWTMFSGGVLRSIQDGDHSVVLHWAHWMDHILYESSVVYTGLEDLTP